MYRWRYLLSGIDSDDYGGWRVPISVSWPRRANDLIPVLKGQQAQDQKELTFSWSQKVGKKSISQLDDGQAGGISLYLGEGSALLFCPGHRLIGWGPHVGKDNLLDLATSSAVKLIQNRPLRNNICPNTWGRIKLTIIVLYKWKLLLIIMVRNAVYFLSWALLLFNILLKLKSHILLPTAFI